jgi:hypothetical protein
MNLISRKLPENQASHLQVSRSRKKIQIMIKRASFIIVFSIYITTGLASVVDSLTLKPKPVYGKEARVVSYILDNNHYRKIRLNDRYRP